MSESRRRSVIELREATSRDIETLADLQRRVRSTAWSLDGWRRELERTQSIVWIAVDEAGGDESVGFVAMWRVLEGLEITDLVVDPDYRRRGIASAMVETVLAVGRAHQIRHVSLEVRQDNEAAIGLYEKFGFETVERIEDFYEDSVAARRMRRVLSS